LPELLFLYLCVGLVVSLATPWPRRLLAVPLWPLFLPALLAPREARFVTVPQPEAVGPIAAALRRMREALALWEPSPSLPLDTTARALQDLERRCRSLATLLARPENQPGEPCPESEARARRRENLLALATLHERLERELGEAICRLDELATRIQLAHFSGRPMEDVARQLADLMSAVELAQAAHTELEDATGTRR
jgi:hypothetical protein